MNKYVEVVGNGEDIEFWINHDLGVPDVIVQVHENSGRYLNVTPAFIGGWSTNGFAVRFFAVPVKDEYTVVVIG